MAVLTASSVEHDSGTFALSGTDWAGADGSWTLTRKASGGSTITVAAIGTVTQNTVPSGSGSFVLNYTDGPSGAGSISGLVYTQSNPWAVGNGVQITLPADTSTRTATIYWGTCGTTGKLTATLSDGSAASQTHTVAAATDAQNLGFVSTIQWSAASASQTLTVKLTTSTSVDGGEQIAFEGIAYTTSSGVTGTISRTLGNATVSASGAETISGTVARTLGNATVAASGTVAVPVTGTISRTLGNATVAASGAETVSGSVARTLGNATVAAAGTETISGSVARTLGNATVAAAGTETISGTINRTLGNATIAASGTGGSGTTGTIAVQLSNATVSASGKETISGTANIVAGNATASVVVSERISGSVSKTLGNATVAITAVEAIRRPQATILGPT